MQIIYNKKTGKIEYAMGNSDNTEMDFRQVFSNHPQEYVDELASLFHEGVLQRDLSDYYINVETLELTRHPQEVIDEKNKYGKILTEEERLNILLQPSYKEVQKAESTLEILSLLQEVELIWV